MLAQVTVRASSRNARSSSGDMAISGRRNTVRLPSAALLDFAQAEDFAALHELAHLLAERLEVVGRAVGIQRGLVRVALHEDVGARRLAVVKRVELAAGLVGIDLG